jgi:hypothetical protein
LKAETESKDKSNGKYSSFSYLIFSRAVYSYKQWEILLESVARPEEEPEGGGGGGFGLKVAKV